MRVRFVLPDENDGDTPVFDKTVSLADVPLPGEDVGIEFPPDHPLAGSGSSWIVEVTRRRWWVGGEEPLVECWLGNDSGTRRHNQYVHYGCRFGYERLMESIARHGKA